MNILTSPTVINKTQLAGKRQFGFSFKFKNKVVLLPVLEMKGGSTELDLNNKIRIFSRAKNIC